MTEHDLANGDVWAVYGQYVDEYNGIVKPDWVFAISRYFRRRWVRHLGAASAWLVVALRQWCYRNGKQNWCIVSRAQLGQDIGVHEVTISDLTAKGFAPWFIISKQSHSYDQRAGRPKQDFNRYVLLMDEPLAPEDFLAIEKLLAEATAAAADPIAMVQELLQDLLAMSDCDLADHLATVAGQILPKAKKQRAGVIEALIERPERTVADLVKTAVEKLPVAFGAEIWGLCSELQRKIVNPDDKYMGTHYFRLKWVPLLGHLLAWMVAALRSRCYWNQETGQLRDECEVWRKTLAEELGCSSKWVNSLPNRPYAGMFFQILESGKKKLTRYWVQMREPLTPDDQAAFQVLLAQEGRIQVDPETRQLAMEFETEQSDRGTLATQKGTLTTLGEGQKGTLATQKGTLTTLGEGQKGTLTTQKGTLTTHLRVLIEYLSSNRVLIKHQQHAGAFSVSVDGDGAVSSLLDLLGIYGSNRARVLDTSLAPDVILAWVLNGLAQPDMGNLAGYVISQVTSADPTPPPQFLEFARLGPEAWELFMAVARGDDREIPTNLRGVFGRWDALFGSQLREEARWARWRDEQARRQACPEPGRRAEMAGRLQSLNSGGAGEVIQTLAGAIVAGQSVWQAALNELQLQMTKATFDTWVRNTRLVSCQDDVFIISAPNAFTRDWLENRLLMTVKRTLLGIVGRPVEVQFVFEESLVNESQM